MFADYHVHTEFSDESVYPMEAIICDAIKMGMDEICFTDHVDYGVKDDWDCGHEINFREGIPYANVDYPNYFAKIDAMKKLYGRNIRIKRGMEFGVQTHTIHKYNTLFMRYPFDFIILSIHQIGDKEFWTQDFQRGKTQREYIEQYYEEMFAIVKEYRNYSVLGHMDLIARYDKEGVYPFENIRELVEEILKTVIADGKGIEFNTSYHRYGLSDTTPCLDILKMYRELNGEIITIGSDSHNPEHLGMHILETHNLLKALGFKAFCTYENMRPVYHSL